MSHLAYVVLAYGLSAITLAALALWIILDQKIQERELAQLEARGIARRSHKVSSVENDGN